MRITPVRRRLLLLGLGSGWLLGRPAGAQTPGPVKVLMPTQAGRIVLTLDMAAAPLTCANFLAHVDKGLLNSGSFYRTVRPDNDNNPATINVIQGGLGDADSPLPPIGHESTRASGLRHIDGVISMARAEPGSASSEFFICIGDNPALDFGGRRNPDGQGFAAFGRVVEGMEVVHRIHALPAVTRAADPYVKGQMIDKPVGLGVLARL
jgi:peptidyl-prolyl cis-trans isomerase A (cyclophilin A)